MKFLPSFQQSYSLKSKQHHFTLLEMVIVLGVSAILLGISLPAFTKLVKGQGVDIAARSISGTLKACRAYAVTNRQYVALVMPQIKAHNGTAVITTGCPSTSTLPASYYNQSYRACIVNKTATAGVYEFQKWVSGEKWEFTPTGALILRIDANSADQAGTKYLTKDLPDDTLYTGKTSLVNNVSFKDVTGSATLIDDVAAIIFKPSGVPVDGNRYVFVGEGVYSGTLTMTNRETKAYSVITINQFTGRVSYGID